MSEANNFLCFICEELWSNETDADNCCNNQCYTNDNYYQEDDYNDYIYCQDYYICRTCGHYSQDRDEILYCGHNEMSYYTCSRGHVSTIFMSNDTFCQICNIDDQSEEEMPEDETPIEQQFVEGFCCHGTSFNYGHVNMENRNEIIMDFCERLEYCQICDN